MARIATSGVQFNVEIGGEGPPLVLLHGFTGGAATWRGHNAVFRKKFKTLAVELLGHGTSDSPADHARYRMESCVVDLTTVFDRLGLQRLNLLGYSLGGRVALHLTASDSDRIGALVLESASPGFAGQAERQARVASDEALANLIEQQGLEAFVEHWSHLPIFASQASLPEGVRAGLRAQRLTNNPSGLANSLRGLGAGVPSPLWDQLKDVRTPTLLIAGGLDPKYAGIARAMAAALPAGRLGLIPGAGHAVHLEQPESFDRLVLEFLTEHNFT